MSLSVRINVQGDGSVAQALSKLSLSASDKTQLFNEIGVNLVENARLRFLDEQAPDGTTWQKSYRAVDQGGATLRDTGVLLASLTHALLPEGVEYGTNVPYAAALHFGATIQAKNKPFLMFKTGRGFARKKEVTIPARPFVGLDSEDENLVVDLISQFLSRNFNA
jgi:phage virion morphogenesis protein